MKHSRNTPTDQAQPFPISVRQPHSAAPSVEHERDEDPLHNPEEGAHNPTTATVGKSSTQTRQRVSGPGIKIWSLGGLSVIELSKRVYKEVLAKNSLGQAAQLAYYFLFALFPFLLFLVTLLGYIPVSHILDRLMDYLSQALPGDSLSLLQDHVHTLVGQQRSGLLSFGIIAALWTASSAMQAVSGALNRAYDVEESRPWWKVRGLAILLAIGLSLFVIAAAVLLIFGPQLGCWIAGGVGLGDVFALTWNILRWPVGIMLLMLGLAILYYFAPDVDRQWHWITPGAAVAVLGWIIASLGFSYYVTNFASYNVTYGSIGTVIVLLIWLYLAGIFILVGGEINAEIEKASKQ